MILRFLTLGRLTLVSQLLGLVSVNALFAPCVSAEISQPQVRERPEWAKFFDDQQVKGTIVVSDERSNSSSVHAFDVARASKRVTPASTFKIPHTLFALDAGVVRDEFQVFRWDSVPRAFPAHNQDQDLRSSMRNSAVWVYEGFAKELGPDRSRRYVESIDYGNNDSSVANGNYWIEGNLQISPFEQITFLKKLYRNELPFRVEHQRLVKDIIVIDAEKNWILRAKTGWSGSLGWFVGWLECPTGPVFFALNIDTPNKLEDLPKRESITREILQSMEVP